MQKKRVEDKMRINKRTAGVLIILIVLGGFFSLYSMEWRYLWSANAGRDDGRSELPAGSYYTVVDEYGKTVFTTGHMVFVGDEFISEDDTRYVITKVEQYVATAKAQGKMEALPPLPSISAQPSGTGSVAIYHTHSDESYIAGDGSDSIPARGGVLNVGEVMSEALSKLGIKGIHDTTPHDPHDDQAYDRSRRTAQRLIRTYSPAAIFDVHRDAGPAEPYLKDVNGQEVAKGTIVIGRQNPKKDTNLEFARRLKDAVNAKYPGLIKGIFLGNADFNQDLSGRALLLEMGTERTSKASAEAGVALIAGMVPSVLGAVGPGATPENRGAGRAIGWILGVVVAGIFVYLWISTGSWEEMKAKILGWFGAGGVRIGGGHDEGQGSSNGQSGAGGGN